jgi:hypothetical protein
VMLIGVTPSVVITTTMVRVSPRTTVRFSLAGMVLVSYHHTDYT